jgi:hypothetical protein
MEKIQNLINTIAVDNKEAILDDLVDIISSQPKRKGQLGMSMVGDECERKLWYSFHHVLGENNFNERTKRIFFTGHISEAFIINDLKKIGCEIYDQQKELSTLDGHLEGHIDGIIKGIPGDEESEYLLEIKTHNQRNFNDVTKHKVRKANFVYYSQVQLYMHHLKLNKCLYVGYSKNDSDYHFEVIEYKKDFCEELIKRCYDIITHEEIPIKKFSPTWYACKWCQYKNICHTSKDKISKNCRTCKNVSIISDGKWHCDFYNKNLSVEEQKKGCNNHEMGWGLS